MTVCYIKLFQETEVHGYNLRCAPHVDNKDLKFMKHTSDPEGVYT